MLDRPRSEPASTSSMFSWETIETIKKKLEVLYLRSPINGSSLTGYFPKMARLPGNPLLGRLSFIPDKNYLITGFGAEVSRLGKLATQHPRGIAYGMLGNIPMFLITKPADIQQVVVYHHAHVSRGPAILPLTESFGVHNMFTLPHNEKWRAVRQTFSSHLFSDAALKKIRLAMHDIIKEHVTAASRKNKPINFHDFFTHLALDVFSRTILGTGPLGEDTLNALRKSIKETMTNLMDYRNNILFFIKSFLKKLKIPVKENTQFLELFKKIIENHADQVLKSDNLITSLVQNQAELEQKASATDSKTEKKEKTKEMLVMDFVLQNALFGLFAGHETTATLMPYAIQQVLNDRSLLNKVFAELDDQKDEKSIDGKIFNEDSLIYRILLETLRKYPPIPTFFKIALDEIVLGNITLTNTPEEYKKAMEKRNKADDIIFKKNCMIVFSPEVMHHSKEYFPNPDHFDPDRFKRNEKITPYTFIPFAAGGPNGGECVGQRFALREAWLTLKEIFSLLRKGCVLTLDNNHPVEEYRLVRHPRDPVSGVFDQDGNSPEAKELCAQAKLKWVERGLEEFIIQNKIAEEFNNLSEKIKALTPKQLADLDSFISDCERQPVSYGLISDQIPRISKYTFVAATLVSALILINTQSVSLAAVAGVLTAGFAFSYFQSCAFQKEKAMRHERTEMVRNHLKLFKPARGTEITFGSRGETQYLPSLRLTHP